MTCLRTSLEINLLRSVNLTCDFWNENSMIKKKKSYNSIENWPISEVAVNDESDESQTNFRNLQNQFSSMHQSEISIQVIKTLNYILLSNFVFKFIGNTHYKILIEIIDARGARRSLLLGTVWQSSLERVEIGGRGKGRSRLIISVIERRAQLPKSNDAPRFVFRIIVRLLIMAFGVGVSILKLFYRLLYQNNLFKKFFWVWASVIYYWKKIMIIQQFLLQIIELAFGSSRVSFCNCSILHECLSPFHASVHLESELKRKNPIFN